MGHLPDYQESSCGGSRRPPWGNIDSSYLRFIYLLISLRKAHPPPPPMPPQLPRSNTHPGPSGPPSHTQAQSQQEISRKQVPWASHGPHPTLQQSRVSNEVLPGGPLLCLLLSPSHLGQGGRGLLWGCRHRWGAPAARSGPLANPPSTLLLPRQSRSLQSHVTGTREPSQGTLQGITSSRARGTWPG